jgi:hypothetical protein
MGGITYDRTTVILYNLINQIIMHDLVEEGNVDSFEIKRRWQRQWQQEVLETMPVTGDANKLFLDWEPLKEQAVLWMQNCDDELKKEALLEECFNFRPYTGFYGFSEKELQKIRVNPAARELALQKICVLLGFEEDILKRFLEYE